MTQALWPQGSTLGRSSASRSSALLGTDDWSHPRFVWASFVLLATPIYLFGIATFRWGEVPPTGPLIVIITGFRAILVPRYAHHRLLLAGVVAAGSLLTGALGFWLAHLTFAQAVWFGVSIPVAGVAISVLYRWLMRDVRWTPLQPSDLFMSVVSSVPILLVGTFTGFLPGTHAFSLDAFNFDYAIRHVVYTTVACLTLPLLWWFPGGWQRWREDLAWMAFLLPSFLVLAYFWVREPDLAPITWTLLVPPFLAGWVLSPPAAGAYSLLCPLLAIVASYGSPLNPFGDGLTRDIVLAEVGFAAGSFTCLTIALFRYRNAALEEKLRREQQESQAQAQTMVGVFESMSDAVIVFDHRGRVVLHNDMALALLGSLPHNESFVDWAARIGLSSPTGQPMSRYEGGTSEEFRGLGVRHELALDRSDMDTRTWLAVSLTAIGYGEDARTLCVLRDITADRERTEELRGFAGIVAHDMRTPLTAVRGWLDVLDDELQDTSEPIVRRAVDSAIQGTRRMAGVVDGWLAFVIERDAGLNLAAERLDDLVEQAAADIPARVRLTTDAPHRVMVDATLVRQVLANLISNAVKYARPEAAPVIHVSSVPQGDTWIRVSVSDNGKGVPQEEREQVFKQFHRVSAHAGSAKGTGVGLALCRRIVERHGGSIGIGRHEGPGATFEFTLPSAELPPSGV